MHLPDPQVSPLRRDTPQQAMSAKERKEQGSKDQVCQLFGGTPGFHQSLQKAQGGGSIPHRKNAGDTTPGGKETPCPPRPGLPGNDESEGDYSQRRVCQGSSCSPQACSSPTETTNKESGSAIYSNDKERTKSRTKEAERVTGERREREEIEGNQREKRKTNERPKQKDGSRPTNSSQNDRPNNSQNSRNSQNSQDSRNPNQNDQSQTKIPYCSPQVSDKNGQEDVPVGHVQPSANIAAPGATGVHHGGVEHAHGGAVRMVSWNVNGARSKLPEIIHTVLHEGIHTVLKLFVYLLF